MPGSEDAIYASFFKSSEFADAEIALTLSGSGEVRVVLQQGSTHVKLQLQVQPVTLTKFPCHRIILDKCLYFAAQARRWQTGSTCTFQVMLDSKAHLPAAEAIIAALYHDTNGLALLDLKQLLDAVLLADKWQAGGFVKDAMEILMQAALQPAAASLLDALAAVEVWPNFLLPLVPALVQVWVDHHSCNSAASTLAAVVAYTKRIQAVLIAALGNLNRVWADPLQHELLLGLPLPAIKLLLESDKLTVDSEDTVYYTAVQYVHKQAPALQSKARSSLAQRIRCAQLSLFCLSNVAITADDSLLLSGYKPQLLRALNLGLPVLLGGNQQKCNLAHVVAQSLPDVPATWKMGPREGCNWQVEEISLVWKLPIEELKQACWSCAARRNAMDLFSENSPPMGGLAWQLMLRCMWRRGAQIALYAKAADAPSGTYLTYHFTAAALAPSRSIVTRSTYADGVQAEHGLGWRDFFSVGAMTGGWNEAAWAAKGLPTSGSLELKLTMHSVGQVK